MKSAKPGFFSGPDFSQSGSKTFQGSGIPEINFFDVMLTKKTVHD